jgi:5,10-methylenetetrahydrofolate reductase
MGYEAIAQATARDHTKTTFVAELMENQLNDVHNLLCITGDSYVGNPRIKQVYDMDSSLMLYEARYLRDNGRTYFTQGKIKNPPKPFLGAAINPFSTPSKMPIKRLTQKIKAGADFIQTQLIFDFERFNDFMKSAKKEGLTDEVFILAGVPVVISSRAAMKILNIPGVYCPDEILSLLQNSQDIKKDGVEFAIELGRKLKNIDGVDGLHLMLLGVDHSILPKIKQEILKGN